MTVSEEIIEQAKAEDKTLFLIRREARREQRRILADKKLTPKEKFAKMKEINSTIKNDSGGMVLTTLNVPSDIRDLADTLVAVGYFPNRSELFRQAIMNYILLWADLITDINQNQVDR